MFHRAWAKKSHHCAIFTLCLVYTFHKLDSSKTLQKTCSGDFSVNDDCLCWLTWLPGPVWTQSPEEVFSWPVVLSTVNVTPSAWRRLTSVLPPGESRSTANERISALCSLNVFCAEHQSINLSIWVVTSILICLIKFSWLADLLTDQLNH